MLSEKHREWIVMRVGDRYRQRYNRHNREVVLQESINCFDLFNSLNTTCIDFEKAFTDLANAYEWDRPNYIRNFNIIEVFMKALYNTVNTETYSVSQQDINDIDKTGYAVLLKSVFCKVPPSCDLSNDNPEIYGQSFKKEYVYAYQKRNSITHSSETGMSSATILNRTIDAALICYLDLLYTHKEGLYAKKNEIIRAGYINKEKFCEEVLKETEKYFRGFKYIDIAWKDDNSNSSSVKIGDLLTSDDNSLKLTGEAGSGKTTALRRIEYLMAKALRNSGKGAVPVYISLNELSEGNNILITAAAEKLNVGIKETKELIKHNEICLLLDGFNEVLNRELKRRIASELDEIAQENEGCRIILTDRSLSRRDMPVLSQARKLILFEMSLEDKVRFIKANCYDAETKKILLEEAEDCPETFVTMKTPLALMHLIEVVKREKSIPLDITGTFIEMLLKRELEEKKDIQLLPKEVVMMVLPKEDVPELIEFLKKELYTGHIGDGKIFVSEVTDIVRVRTGEEGEAALISGEK